MTQKTKPDKRLLPRHLCTDKFSNSLLEYESESVQIQSINYNHRGIALFSMNPLPKLDACHISFSYSTGNKTLRIERLPCFFRHVNEMDIGSQYGIEFDLVTGHSFKHLLLEIEQRLEENVNNGDRYGLFS